MKNENFIIINGQKLDSVTGKPVAVAREHKASILANSISKKSQTIYHNAIKRPINKTLSRRPGGNMDISRSKKISRFANSKITLKPTQALKTEAPAPHPIVSMGERRQKLLRNHLANQKPATKDLQTIKQDAITEALAAPKSIQKEKSFIKKHLRSIVICSIIAIGIATAYATYSNIPSFSVKIASAQAGINATFPGYCPDGYGISGPVRYSNNQVLIKFKSNTDSTNFSISQTRSSWDSTAVKNKVNKDSSGIFSTTEERGLTVYVYNGNAAWVNGGILYEIKGNALLSSYQIRKIATSL